MQRNKAFDKEDKINGRKRFRPLFYVAKASENELPAAGHIGVRPGVLYKAIAFWIVLKINTAQSDLQGLFI